MMPSQLCITIRFLQPYFHGRCDGDAPEWPPSPLRLYQALVAAAAARLNERVKLERTLPALRWLEQLPPPTIIAPHGRPVQTGYRTYVPDNVGDLVAGSWAAGRPADIADHGINKDFRPTHMEGEAVHFLFSLPEDGCPQLKTLVAAARAVTHVGWGIDMVVGNAAVVTEEEAKALDGETWLPSNTTAGSRLRAVKGGTLEELIQKHGAFLNRFTHDSNGSESFRPVPPLTKFRVVGYHRAIDPEPCQYAAFGLLRPDATGYLPFDTTRRARDIAGMVRHAVAETAFQQGWSDEQINVFVHGKTVDGTQPASGDKSPDRFQYLPLPTINHKLNRVGSIRRVLVTAPAHCDGQITWLRRALAGVDLRTNDNTTSALLTIVPASDWVLGQYVGQCRSWSTVTPVILPVHDGYDPNTAGKWLRKAFEHGGYAPELVSQIDLEWRRGGFLAGVDVASRYLPPKNLENKPRYHVRVRFPHPIAGPVAVGSGRFRGFGLFALTQVGDEVDADTPADR